MSFRAARSVGLALMSAAAACAPKEAAPPAAVVRDSAGVRIVENGTLDPDRVAARLGRPIFRTGWEDDEPTFEFVFEGRLLRGGRAAVLDHNGVAVYLLSPTGSVEWKLGSRGDGPGELRSVDAVVEGRGDTLFIYDRVANRISAFTTTGEFAWSTAWLPARPVTNEPARSVPDGRLLFLPEDPNNSRFEPGDGWLPASIFLADLRTTVADTVATVDYRLQRHLDGITREMMTFGRTSATGTGWVYARNDETEVRWYTLDGTLARLSRWSEDRELTATKSAAYVAAQMEQYVQGREFSPGREAEMRRIYEAILDGWNDRAPVFAELLADRTGDVWMGEFPLAGSYATRYRIFAPDGTLQGWVEAPPNFWPLDIRDGLVLGVEIDELDIHAISLYRIER